MKPTYKDCGLIRDEQENLIGVNLGWDFTAEHEWGIATIKRMLGIEGKGYGANRHLISKPEAIEFGSKMINKKKWGTISPRKKHEYSRDANEFLPKETSRGVVEAAWSGENFVVAIADKDAYAAIMKAIQEGDAILTIDLLFASESNPFSRSGLKILIRSAIPKDWDEAWIEAHKNQERIQKAKDDTGIADRLAKADKRYFALSPRWTPENKKAETKHPVIFWLNPSEQDTVNFGYFTVEELDQWIRNEGPIPKVAKSGNKA